MFRVSIYSYGKPEYFEAGSKECADVIAGMTGIATSQANEYLAKAMLLKRVRIVGPFELAIDYGESETEPLLIFHEPEYDPSQEPDDEDDV